jgi:hypothetical protein
VPKPTWVDQPLSRLDGDDAFTLSVGPHASQALCEADLTPALRQRVDSYIDQFIGEPGAARRVNLSMAYIRDRLVKEQYYETVDASFAKMLNLHVLVRIDPTTKDLIRRQHQEALVQARLGYAGSAFALMLVLIGTAFGYLKLDTITKGYYSGRLKLAATAVILTAAAATVLVVRQADPAAGWPLGAQAESPRLVEY